MAWAGNNQLLFNAALNGMMAGVHAGQPNPGNPSAPLTAASYAAIATASAAFAKELDSLIATDPQLATGANGTSVPPATAAETSGQSAKVGIVYGLSEAYWRDRRGIGFSADAGATPADYLPAATAISVIYTASVTQYGLSFSLT